MIFLALLTFLTSCSLSAATVNGNGSSTEYDTIIIGGGPAGLSALSGLARVRRHVLLIDSGEYRNGATRHMHDVIGLDGVTPAYFRWLAREKIAYYPTVSWTNGTVTDIEPQGTSGDPSYTVSVTYPSGEQAVLAARSVVIATGLKDVIPGTPGLRENWAQGIYWCPWCDGYEHADQALGLLGSLDAIPGMVREVRTLDADLVAFVNGTDTPDVRSTADSAFPGWETYLVENNVTVYNQTLASITRLANGSTNGSDPSAPTHPEHDLFSVELDDGTAVERAAFFTSFPSVQRSNLGRDLGVIVQNGRLAGVQGLGYLTNIPMVYAVGDINIDDSTNVPHAMYSGKKAAVFLHVALAKQEAAAQIAAAGEDASPAAKRVAEPELDPREVWEVMNGPRDDILHAGDFDRDEY
ncbi:FAD/NAD(P)-binding domain-containing protein [Cryphonectria parasitica EP155]|uniref:FAD/NAD(P)-binding domain-containing protein n=1 Tax=Cryphonectria parasitica (strain ATCC 38755 / EP155) TaxID=660469 RepID=A0A9P4Y9K8_CRYP1|nr:FAD/NAD(P)-binding domain-containing protein [Cryphonectria parasitica EP155]KAF3769477.1 FAD/NAD(P)-binding domain-containing protein [Cryphonectria parasitica EP155]